MKYSIVRQRRKSMALQHTPNGLRILIPNSLKADDKQIRAFVEQSLRTMPDAPARLAQPHSHEAVYDLANQWAERIGVQIMRAQIRTMRSKWGSISTAGYLTLADDLLWLPLELAEYVVVHELLHLKFPNHAKGWKVSMDMYLPDWRQREQMLQAHATDTADYAASARD